MSKVGPLDRPVHSVAQGRYVIEGVLGTGGMATVYRAHDTRLDLSRAVKILNPELVSSPSLRKRFEMEARTMARLHHPNIVGVFDIGVEDELAFMVMELIEGGSLNDHIKNSGYLLPRTALASASAILAALVLAHGRGIIHRDIKPHNVLVTLDGTPKLTDFGIAHLIGQDKALTASNAVIGTWAFMAPEQRKSSRRVTVHSDIYAVGATLYALLTARDPFDIYNKELQREMFSGLPEPLVEIIERATRYWPEERYASAADMLTAVQRADGLLKPEYLDDPVRPVPVLEGSGNSGGNLRTHPSGGRGAEPGEAHTFDSALLEGRKQQDVGATLAPTSSSTTADTAARTENRSAEQEAALADEEATPIDVWREKLDPTDRLRRATARGQEVVPGGLAGPVAPPIASTSIPQHLILAPQAPPLTSPVRAVRPSPVRARADPARLVFAAVLLGLLAFGAWKVWSPSPPPSPVVAPVQPAPAAASAPPVKSPEAATSPADKTRPLHPAAPKARGARPPKPTTTDQQAPRPETSTEQLQALPGQ